MQTLSDNIAFNVQNLSKSYLIDGDSGGKRINALCDVSFDMHKKEILGIIGPNGSGKSTLLKIISEITAPDSGYVDVFGSVASILEVGTGFNPDLSGRKNIFMNARLHGMKKDEVEDKWDSIISLFGFPDFLDTAVKHYSSGMYMRLAFAIVVHIEADIYLFDEVLSVGDMKFQQKCLELIRGLRDKGKSIGIVTHAPSQIAGICDRMMILDEGKLVRSGYPDDMLMHYMEIVLGLNSDKSSRLYIEEKQIAARKKMLTPDQIGFELLKLEILDAPANGRIDPHNDTHIRLQISVQSDDPIGVGFFILERSYNQVVLSNEIPPKIFDSDKIYQLDFIIKAGSFNTLYASLGVFVSRNETLHIVYPDMLQFSFFSDTASSIHQLKGLLALNIECDVSSLD